MAAHGARAGPVARAREGAPRGARPRRGGDQRSLRGRGAERDADAEARRGPRERERRRGGIRPSDRRQRCPAGAHPGLRVEASRAARWCGRSVRRRRPGRRIDHSQLLSQLTEEAPYGSWASPISIDLVLKAAIAVGLPRWDGSDLYWTESRPQEGGRQVLVRRAPDGAVGYPI